MSLIRRTVRPQALELQTVTPVPKPHFERISYTARYEGNYFGGESTSEGNQFKYSEWSHYVPTDPSDLDKEIVQVPPWAAHPRTHMPRPATL